ncbi:MAG: hypothetical protein JWQ39_296 [Glaciihabitans sp.]|nr:hypothetical protein [Glaciihabitans sp.]
MQLGSYAGGVMVQRGAAATPWLFYIPALVFGLFAMNLAVTPLWASTHESDLAWADGGLTVVLLGLWYFVIARVPNWRRARALKRAVPGAVLVRGARINTHGNAWLAEIARRNGNRSGRIRQVAGLVATPNDLQFWSGAGDNLALAGSVNWADIRSITVANSRVEIEAKDAAFAFAVINDRWISTSLLRGARLTRLVVQLDGLRHNGEDA